MMTQHQAQDRAAGICPVCNGTCRVAVPEDLQRYKGVCYGYDAATDTLPCRNCGGQYQFGSGPTGRVPLNREGQPCTHEYTSQTVGRCYHRHSCAHCGDVYHIDSGD